MDSQQPGPASTGGTVPGFRSGILNPAGWLAGIGDDLAAAGLATRLGRTSAGTDLTITATPPGRRETDLILDEDGYAELRFWVSLEDAPARVAATIRAAIAAVAGSHRG